jgi:hypothetical protein
MSVHSRPLLKEYFLFVCCWRSSPQWATASSFTRFLDHTQQRTTVGRIPLDEWSARRKDLYLTTHNTHNRQISIPPVGFEPTAPAGERPQTYALDRATTGLTEYKTPKTNKILIESKFPYLNRNGPQYNTHCEYQSWCLLLYSLILLVSRAQSIIFAIVLL